MLLIAGTDIGFVTDAKSSSSPTSLGTLGGFVRDPHGNVCAITNLHVVDSALTSSKAGYIGKTMGMGYQPAVTTSADPSYGRYDAEADFAITPVLSNNTVSNAVLKDGVRTPLRLGKTKQIEPGANVYKFGHKTNYTKGKINVVKLDGALPAAYQAPGKLQIKNAFVVEPIDGSSAFCDDGDSGSLVVLADTDEVIGLLFKKCINMTKGGDLVTYGIVYPFATQVPDSFAFIDTSKGPVGT